MQQVWHSEGSLYNVPGVTVILVPDNEKSRRKKKEEKPLRHTKCEERENCFRRVQFFRKMQ